MGAVSPHNLEDEARTLVERLGGRWTAGGGMCRCPAHDDRSPSLSIRPGRRRLLFHCFAGCDAGQILEALGEQRLLEPSCAHAARSPEPMRGSPLIDAAARVWSASRSIGGTAAADYLASRGLESFSPELRFNPRTPHGRAPDTRFRPALIAAVRDDSGLTGILRTFLDPPPPDQAGAGARRAGLGRFGGGAVRLGGCAPSLGLAEGIETALSATRLFGIPCWATLGTERFGLVALPPTLEALHLFVDHDAGGRRAEQLARSAFPQLPIEVHTPPRRGDDWNDVLRVRLAARSGEGGEEAPGR